MLSLLLVNLPEDLTDLKQEQQKSYSMIFDFPEKEATKKNINRIHRFFDGYSKLIIGNCTISNASDGKAIYLKHSKNVDIEIKDLLKTIAKVIYSDEYEILPRIGYVYTKYSGYGNSSEVVSLISIEKATPEYIKYCRDLAKNLRSMVGEYEKYHISPSSFVIKNGDTSKYSYLGSPERNLIYLYKTAYLVSITGFCLRNIPFQSTSRIETGKYSNDMYFTPKGKYYYYKFAPNSAGDLCPYQPDPSKYFSNVKIYKEQYNTYGQYRTCYTFTITDDDLFIPKSLYTQEMINDFLDTQWLEYRLMFENLKE